MKNMTDGQETIYKEYSGARWNYWTYSEGVKIPINLKQFSIMENQGAKVVNVK